MTALPRAIPLEGGSNLRDLGGYATRDGRQLRFGQVFRSANLHRLTDADLAVLTRLGVRTICDFRGEDERAKMPSRLPPAGVAVHELAIASTAGVSLRDLLANQAATPADMVAVMTQAYTAYAQDWHHHYRTLFDLLLAEDAGPLLFHCTAGKDRTGFAAALILTALDVPEETIWDDYLATNRLWTADPQIAASLPPEIRQILLTVSREFLEASYASIRGSHGGMDAYLEDRMGLDTARRDALRARMLE